MNVQRIRAAHVLTQDAHRRWLSPGVIEVRDGRISAVAAPDDLEAAPEAEHLDLPGMVLPGFVDTHAHTPMVLLRGAGEGLPVDRWLSEVMWPRESRLTPDDIGWGMRLGGAQLLRGGVTTSVEMYFAPDVMADAAREIGLRSMIAPPLIVSDELVETFGTWEHQLEVMVAFARAHRDDPLIDGIIGPHSAYSVPAIPLREAGRVAVAEDLLLHLHVAEGEHEGDRIVAEHGMRVPAWLEHLGVLEARVLAAHGVWLDETDIAIFAANGTAVAHCPCSNGKHASGLAPVTALRAAGVDVAIATDGPASHDRLDVFAEMRAAIHLARLRERDASVLGPHQALAMVTSEAARALGRDDIGVIEVGRRADLQHVALDDLGPVVEPDDLLTHLVWSGSPSIVRDVWVEGRRVVSDGEVTTLDLARAAREVETRARRLATA